jgi:hypothetical protein
VADMTTGRSVLLPGWRGEPAGQRLIAGAPATAAPLLLMPGVPSGRPCNLQLATCLQNEKDYNYGLPAIRFRPSSVDEAPAYLADPVFSECTVPIVYYRCAGQRMPWADVPACLCVCVCVRASMGTAHWQQATQAPITLLASGARWNNTPLDSTPLPACLPACLPAATTWSTWRTPSATTPPACTAP